MFHWFVINWLDSKAHVFIFFRGEEIVMPAEQTGLVRENYLWKVKLYTCIYIWYMCAYINMCFTTHVHVHVKDTQTYMYLVSKS